MSDETTLLPCPFCGGEIPAPTRRYMSVLICPTCNAYGPGNSDMTNDELIAAWNTRATHGTLTAELVEKIVDRNCEWYEGGEIDAQAIVDELNAVLGSGKCNPVETATLENATAHVMECDMCGRTYEHVNGDYEHCPRCGRKAER